MKKEKSEPKIITKTFSEFVEMAGVSKSSMHAALQKFGLPTKRGLRYTLMDFLCAWRAYHTDNIDWMFLALMQAECRRVRVDAGLPIPEAWEEEN